MSNTKTQMQWTINRLLIDGFVSRNSALQNYFTRLSGRILDLKNDGWEIEGKWVKTEHEKDFQYFLIKSPYKKQEYILPDGRTITKIIK